MFDKIRQSVVSCLRTNYSSSAPSVKGETMAYKINRVITVKGEKKWIRANTEQEYADKLTQSLSTASDVTKHKFVDYAQEWFELYSEPNISSATAQCYMRQMRLHIFPVLKDKFLEDVTTADVQTIFNRMHGAKTSKQRTRTVLNMIFESALDDELIGKNPLRSRRIKITGKASKETEPYSVEQMQALICGLPLIRSDSDRNYLAIHTLHPLRLEEVLGLKWEDIDLDGMTLYVRRAVTHPTRNQPEIKETKTEASRRGLALSNIARQYLTPGEPDEFVVGGKKPLSYQQVKRMCWRIRDDIGFEENVTPGRFRATVLTDIYEQTKDIKMTQAAAGHTTSAMTLKYYVKGRSVSRQAADAIDKTYGLH